MTVDKLPENESGICVVRSHGMPPVQIKEMTDKGFEVVDLTCLDVKKVQQKAVELAKEDFLVLILGKPEHPEVIAITANAQMHSNKVLVIPDLTTLQNFECEIKDNGKVGIVIQTTQKLEFLQDVVNYLITITKELKVFNTICKSTAMRQTEAKKLAVDSDLMIVVGSKKSANTTHLAEILSDIKQTIHIENKEGLTFYKNLIEKSQKIGVAAGASTPDDIINDVINELNKY